MAARSVWELKLFRRMVKLVPAYADFLRTQGFQPSWVRCVDDLDCVPPLTRANYLQRYPLNELLFHGQFTPGCTIHSSSGTEGVPVFYARAYECDRMRAAIVERFLAQECESVLLVNCFALGVWSAGLGFYRACLVGSRRARPRIALVSPGLNLREATRTVQTLSGFFDSVVLAGYPSFVFDVVSALREEGFRFPNRARFIFTGEGYPESFRKLLCQLAGCAEPHRDTMGVYGTSELGVVGVETPYTIGLREILSMPSGGSGSVQRGAKPGGDQPAWQLSIGGGSPSSVPMIFEPASPQIAVHEREGLLMMTGNMGLPLLNYLPGDCGTVMTVDALERNFEISLARPAGLPGCPFPGVGDQGDTQLIFLSGRNEEFVSIYGVKIRPDYLRPAFASEPCLSWATGRFVMRSGYDEDGSQHWEIHIESKAAECAGQTLLQEAQCVLVARLCACSSEFAELRQRLGQRVEPHVTCWPRGAAPYFVSTNKHRWIDRSVER